jgi:two-component system response regulator FixJ
MSTEPTVYIVDDDPAALDSVASLVRSRSLPVRTFTSAEDFLAQADPALAGCVVADVRMPGMSGIDLLGELKNRGVCLPVIIITGFADVPMAVQAMHRGAVTFLEKPCHAQELYSAIDRALNAAHELQARKQFADEYQARRGQLTPDEVKVMDRMVAGVPNKVIAAELDMGLRTVELRRANVLKKMKAESLAELVRIVIQGSHSPASTS